MLGAGAPAAHAERWFVVEAPAAVAVSEPQATAFHAGVMPALGLYTDNGTVAFGVRLRAGVLSNGGAPGSGLADPGMGGLATAGLALRLGVRGPWLEGVVGGGVTGKDAVPAVEAGVGWDFAVGSVDLGPSARYLRLINRDTMATLGSADLVLVGLDVRFGRSRPARVAQAAVVVAPPPVAPPPVAPPPPPPPLERDHDEAVDREAGCEQDPKGCEIAEHIFLKNDRIVLEERVLFDTDRAHVKSAGRGMIGDILRVWHNHPEWRSLTIEGHADVRGSDDYNLELSTRRAESVRAAFVALGADPAKIQAVGYGRSRPRDPGMTDAAHQLNRRVEFVIEREQSRSMGASR